MQALHNHCAGKGNSTHHIADAKCIQTALHYKSKCALPFNKFLDSLQKMFMIFQEEREPLTKHAKVDELLTKVQHPVLMAAITQLHFQLNIEGVTFTVTTNHLNSAMSQTLNYQMAFQIQSTNTSQRGGGNNHFGGHGSGCFNNSGCGGCGHGCAGHSYSNNSNTQTKPNSSVYYPLAEWNKLLFEECDKIHKECKDKPDQSGTPKRNLGEISIKHVTAIIEAMQQTQPSNEETSNNTDDTTPKHINTSNAFRGKANAKKVRIK